MVRAFRSSICALILARHSSVFRFFRALSSRRMVRWGSSLVLGVDALRPFLEAALTRFLQAIRASAVSPRQKGASNDVIPDLKFFSGTMSVMASTTIEGGREKESQLVLEL